MASSAPAQASAPVAAGSVPLVAVAVPLAALLGSILALLLASAPQRLVLAPMLALVNTLVLLLCLPWARDRELPLFDLGVICGVMTALYALVPLAGFYFSGLRWTVLSDPRLVQYSPTPAQTGQLGWRYALYFAALAAAYLSLRGRGVPRVPLRLPSGATIAAILLLAAGLTAYFWTIRVVYGVSYHISYDQMHAGEEVPTLLPYFLQQVSHNLDASLMMVKQWLFIILIALWRNRLARFTLLAWLALELVWSAVLMGARGDTAFLLLSAVLLYHRFVRPLTLRSAAIVGGLCIGAALLYGVRRDYGEAARTLSQLDLPIWSASNEFQSLFATAFDLLMRKQAGSLPAMPLAARFSELTLSIPSQLLPYYKWEPAEWYLQIVGLRGTGFGGMFGVISQGIVGFDWAELAVRGLALGGILALIHRWYVRHAQAFWATAFYMFLCGWSYYTMRAGTFYIHVYLVYQFLPCVLFVWVTRDLLRLTTAVGGRAVYAPSAPEPSL